jgi:hypothetical protein
MERVEGLQIYVKSGFQVIGGIDLPVKPKRRQTILREKDTFHSSSTSCIQGCQIFLGTIYQNGKIFTDRP